MVTAADNEIMHIITCNATQAVHNQVLGRCGLAKEFGTCLMMGGVIRPLGFDNVCKEGVDGILIRLITA
jgi:hypothetical protein